MSAQAAGPVRAPNSESIWGGIGGFLSDAVATYGQYEAVKARKNSTGQGRLEHAATPELDNAAVQVEANKALPTSQNSAEPEILGIPQKTVIMAFGGLLAIGLLMKVAK
ncbi:hypothetical protein [Pseudoalteromonas sp. MMG013]|uniref:hypothetical protein n=1 Tax=Pseudoalteromonas sp. MMG013 TaxID=2822687 RepID=UPI001FFCE25E|nr:hypothetical protein [Pseudoalteromonas sp. MMG013]